MRRADRLFQIVQHLRARRLTTAAQLAELLGVSERTIYRDVRDLSLGGVPIQGEAGVGYRVDRSFELTALMFTPDELEAVVVGLRMAQSFAGPKLRAASALALNKVILALPNARRAEVERPQMYAPPVHRHTAIDELLEQMRTAIDEHAMLKLDYADANERSTKRTVRPIALHFWGAAWTLVAWCELRNDFRVFRLDRVAGCVRTGATFVEEDGKRLDDYLTQMRAKLRERGIATT